MTALLLMATFSTTSCEPRPCCSASPGAEMEENLRRALLLSRGDWGTFVSRPLSAGLLGAALLMVIIVTLPTIRKKREVAFQEE